MANIKSPRYTQTPNVLFDKYLADMGLAELKVVMAISRKTFGWHQNGCRISIRSLAALTGLSENGVLSGARAAQKRGILKKISGDRRITYWELIVENSASEAVEPAETSTSASEVVEESSDNGDTSASEAKLPQPVRQTTSASEARLKKGLKKKEKELKDIIWIQFLELWKELFPKKPQPRKDNKNLKGKINTRIQEQLFLDNWQEALERASESPTCQKQSWFHAEFFLRNSDNYMKCYERWQEWQDEKITGVVEGGRKVRNFSHERRDELQQGQTT